ncbi:MAG: hypothetical protein AAGA43_06905 [Bacteroidota bacterium]
MKVPPLLLGVFLILLISVSCESDSTEETLDPTPLPPEGITISTLAGNWEATMAVFDIRNAGEAESVDIIEQGGTVSFVISSNGSYTLTITAPGENPDIFDGTIAIINNQLEITFSDSPDEFQRFDFQATSITLDIQGALQLDFDNDGTNELADFRFDFNRVGT